MISDEDQALLVQAKSDLDVFRLLAGQDRAAVPACHPLHYLQMATEKLAKAVQRRMHPQPPDKLSHVAFSQMPFQLRRRDVARALGWEQFSQFRGFLRSIRQLCQAIEGLSPAVAGSTRLIDSPNVEYPWRGRDAQDHKITGWLVPAQEVFPTLDEIQQSVYGRQFLEFVSGLIDRFDQLPVARRA